MKQIYDIPELLELKKIKPVKDNLKDDFEL